MDWSPRRRMYFELGKEQVNVLNVTRIVHVFYCNDEEINKEEKHGFRKKYLNSLKVLKFYQVYQ